MLFAAFNDVIFVNITIAGQIIMWFFVAVAVLSFILFLFNLIFIRPGTRKKKNLTPELLKQREERQDFEKQKDDVEIEIALVLKVEEEDTKLANFKNS